MLDVEFEWFDPEEIDFHGLKALLRQLFDVDNQLFDLSALANLIIAQTATVGSTVKVDGKAEDPFAFMSVVNMHTHKVGHEGSVAMQAIQLSDCRASRLCRISNDISHKRPRKACRSWAGYFQTHRVKLASYWESASSTCLPR